MSGPRLPVFYRGTALAGGALIASALVVLIAHPALGDYGPVPSADNPAPSIEAMLDGDFSRAANLQPLMGSVSLVVRLPAAALGRAIGGHELEYRAGALVCLWALALVAMVISQWPRKPLARVSTFAMIVGGPVTLAAMSVGHPEELLGAAFATIAVVAAGRDRPIAAGALVGLATATKPWCLLALAPVFLALHRGRLRAAATAAAVTVVTAGPLAVAGLHRLTWDSRMIGGTHRVYPQSIWWPFSRALHSNHLDSAALSHVVGAYALPGGLTRSAGEALTFALAAVVATAYWRTRGSVACGEALALLAGLTLSRCVLDPMNLLYYAVPFIAALAAWDASTRHSLPLVTILASVLMLATLDHPPGDPALACALFLLWSVPLAAYLLVAPARLGRRSLEQLPWRRPRQIAATG